MSCQFQANNFVRKSLSYSLKDAIKFTIKVYLVLILFGAISAALEAAAARLFWGAKHASSALYCLPSLPLSPTAEP